ncbi:hypothetical protein RJ55_01659 [Drechmeria coniospora]|nr:hypothetical protein RJ55_01659 [Drechmeria coniospora]
MRQCSLSLEWEGRLMILMTPLGRPEEVAAGILAADVFVFGLRRKQAPAVPPAMGKGKRRWTVTVGELGTHRVGWLGRHKTAASQFSRESHNASTNDP